MSTEDRIYWAVVAFLAVVGAAVAAAALIWPHPKPVIETAKPAIVQSDESLILERTDTQPSVKPPHVVPKGGKVERVVSVTVQPKTRTTPASTGHLLSKQSGLSLMGINRQSTERQEVLSSLSGDDCPPVTIDLSLVREKGGGKRVIASSPDGAIVSGLDIPIETLTYKPRVWAAGISVDPVHQVGGVWIERDISRIRLGAEVGANKFHDFETRLRVGVTW